MYFKLRFRRHLVNIKLCAGYPLRILRQDKHLEPLSKKKED